MTVDVTVSILRRQDRNQRIIWWEMPVNSKSQRACSAEQGTMFFVSLLWAFIWFFFLCGNLDKHLNPQGQVALRIQHAPAPPQLLLQVAGQYRVSEPRCWCWDLSVRPWFNTNQTHTVSNGKVFLCISDRHPLSLRLWSNLSKFRNHPHRVYVHCQTIPKSPRIIFHSCKFKAE